MPDLPREYICVQPIRAGGFQVDILATDENGRRIFTSDPARYGTLAMAMKFAHALASCTRFPIIIGKRNK